MQVSNHVQIVRVIYEVNYVRAAKVLMEAWKNICRTPLLRAPSQPLEGLHKEAVVGVGLLH